MVPMNASHVLVAQARTWGRLATTSVAHMTEHLYVGIITVVLPVMAASLGLSNTQAGVLVSVRSLVAGLSNIPSGLLADLTRKRSLFLGLCLFIMGLSSMFMSWAPGFGALLVFMALIGVGSGGFHPQALAILSAAYRDRRGLALGIHDSSGNLGEIVAPLTIGTLLTFMTWRGTLQVWAVPGLLVGLLYALLCVEARALEPRRSRFSRSLWDDILTNRAVLVIFVISVFRTMGQTSLLLILPLYMSRELQLSPQAYSSYISILFLFAAVGPSISGWVSDRIGRAPLLIGGLAVSAVSVVAIPHLSPGIHLSIAMVLIGTALWALRPVVFAAAMEVTPPQLAGTLVAFLFTGNMGMSSVAPIVAGLVADAYGLGMAMVFVGLFPLLGCLVALGAATGASQS